MTKLMDERIVWHGTSSQVVNSGTFAVCGLAGAGLVVLFWRLAFLPGWFCVFPLALAAIAAQAWLRVRCTSYELTTQRLRTWRGVLTRRIDDLELYRVKDIILEKPFRLRLVGLGNLVLITSDLTTPVLRMGAIRGPDRVHELIRTYVEAERDRKGAHEVTLTEGSEPAAVR